MTSEMAQGKAAIIFGAATGIGRATALAFAGLGARMMLADVAEEALEQTRREAAGVGADARGRVVDLRDDTAVGGAVAAAVDAFGGLDHGINVAGTEGLEVANLAESSDANWDLVIGVNLKGTWSCMRHELRSMTSGGSIVNVSSTAALVGFPGLSTYAASKAGILALTRTAAIEYAESGIRVNAVCPGSVDTGMRARTAAMRPAQKSYIEGRESSSSLTRSSDPAEIASAIVWLASDQASFCTGHALVVDGGYVVR